MWRRRSPSMVALRIATIFRTTGFCISSRASVVTSRALETCPGASRPSGRTKCESSRPGCRARRFISATNLVSLPRPTWSASAQAASFALWMSAASTRSRTEIRSPARRPMLGLADGGRIGRNRDHVAELHRRRRSSDRRGHHLRQARDRDPLAGVVREQHLSGASVLDEIGARVDARSGSEGRAERGRVRPRRRAGPTSRAGRLAVKARRGRRARRPSRAGGTRPGARTASLLCASPSSPPRG